MASPVKLIHVLKRLEILDRDIAELRELEDTLGKNRSYSDSLKISVELQINNLLNERVKLMELRIENPPEVLIPSSKELTEPSKKLTENRGKFNLADLEEDYLDKLLNKSERFDADQTDRVVENKIKADQDYVKWQRKHGTMSQDAVDDLIEETANKKKPQRSTKAKSSRGVSVEGSKKAKPKSRADVLKDIPQVDY